MTIEVLAIGTLILIALIAIAVYRDYRKDKQAEELAEFEASVKKLQEAWKPVPIMERHIWHDTTKITYINTDELCRQAQDYERFADTQAIPEFIEDSLDRRTVEDDELPEVFRGWDDASVD